MKFTYKIPAELTELPDYEFCEICHRNPDKCECPDVDFENNVRNADGKVNAVGYFNNHGDSFFNLKEIEIKIDELKKAILSTSNLYHKRDWSILLFAALSIQQKLNHIKFNEKFKKYGFRIS